LRFLQRY